MQPFSWVTLHFSDGTIPCNVCGLVAGFYCAAAAAAACIRSCEQLTFNYEPDWSLDKDAATMKRFVAVTSTG